MPIWSRNLPRTSRFIILPGFNNEAVMDEKTGLVWERAPSGGRCQSHSINASLPPRF